MIQSDRDVTVRTSLLDQRVRPAANRGADSRERRLLTIADLRPRLNQVRHDDAPRNTVDHEVVVLPQGAEDPTVIWLTDPEADGGLVRPVSAEGVRVAP